MTGRNGVRAGTQVISVWLLAILSYPIPPITLPYLLALGHANLSPNHIKTHKEHMRQNEHKQTTITLLTLANSPN